MGFGTDWSRLLSYFSLVGEFTRPGGRGSNQRRMALVLAPSKVVDLAETIPVICRDPDDDRLIACAVVGEADLIASGDGDLLALE